MNILKICAGVAMGIACLGFAACGGTNSNYLYEADFSKADNGVFTTKYGSVTHNADADTVTINNVDNSGSMTYFGNDETANTEVNLNSTVVSINIKIDSTSMDVGDGFTWTVSVNGVADTDNNYSFLTERSIYFRNYAEGVKVGYVENGVNDAINQEATSNATAVTLADGWYDVNFAFTTTEDNEVVFTITVVNADDQEVFKQENAKLGSSSATEATTSQVGGLRYGWFSWMSADSVEVSAITVSK